MPRSSTSPLCCVTPGQASQGLRATSARRHYPALANAMSNADFLGRAIESVKKAIETDTAGDYEKAYQQYYSARESRTPLSV